MGEDREKRIEQVKAQIELNELMSKAVCLLDSREAIEDQIMSILRIGLQDYKSTRLGDLSSRFNLHCRKVLGITLSELLDDMKDRKLVTTYASHGGSRTFVLPYAEYIEFAEGQLAKGYSLARLQTVMEPPPKPRAGRESDDSE